MKMKNDGLQRREFLTNSFAAGGLTGCCWVSNLPPSYLQIIENIRVTPVEDMTMRVDHRPVLNYDAIRAAAPSAKQDLQPPRIWATERKLGKSGRRERRDLSWP